MKYILFIIKSAFEDLRRNKIRTLLTSLGILIGVASVVLLLAFGLGLKKFISNQFDSLGTNLIYVLPGQIFQNGQFKSGPSAMSAIRFDERDLQSLRRVRLAQNVVPQFTRSVVANFEGKNENGDIYATTEEIFTVRKLIPLYGRVFDKNDSQKSAKIVVLGPKIAKKLFESEEASLNKTIKIGNQSYRVIGVLESKGGGGLGGPDLDSFIYMPYRSALSFNPEKKFLSLIIKASDQESIVPLKEQVKFALTKRYKADDFSIAEQTEILNAINSIFSALNSVLIAIAAISLVVGGIGIMNIMYVSVVERIREIGIRRAIGARKTDILFQFLSEAIALSLLGCILGLFVSFLIVALVQRFFPAYISLESVLISVCVSSAIGILFGVFPAKKAADLSPIEAIRYE